MRTLYQKCKLVHGDLSEYNILYFEGHLYIIDVSQSVDPDHPAALDFLRRDCNHVSEFFEKHGVTVMDKKELFNFIVDASIADDAVDSYLEEVQQKILSKGGVSVEDEIADKVFEEAHIPKRLADVKNAEEDVLRLTSGKDTGDLYYMTITGLKHALSITQSSLQNDQQKQKSHVISDGKSNLLEGDAESQSDEDEDDEGDSEELSFSESEAGDPLDKKAARKEARKENKKKVKEEKREARKNKVPKAVKKRKKKLSKAPKTR